ncbi:hypothetical protein PJF56_16285 [Roseofilum sp. BLCC_M91]|uniref:Uncharacterized protein n=1 Tax=Roseofilum halophilum BLCC-M91 TaxID=3022259 RepID=A0ABT7BMK4_9CYAN|nr:hypothetical protein [Roseofilum halophilum]MDJ1180422.1 hypothetical protein [Roseofilum halophilum BLCC-M91]
MKSVINEAQMLEDLELLQECEQSARELYELSIAFANQCQEIVKEASAIEPREKTVSDLHDN